jgi:hypothetical protein
MIHLFLVAGKKKKTKEEEEDSEKGSFLQKVVHHNRMGVNQGISGFEIHRWLMEEEEMKGASFFFWNSFSCSLYPYGFHGICHGLTCANLSHS